jgi:DNA-binding CsgD family transcriptional regulator/tetratricopeptide (TPR) repeat protein
VVGFPAGLGAMVQDRRAPLDVFVGRAAELDRVAQVVAAAEAGQPWLVTIEGEPGVGKTALARRILARAGAGNADLKVLTARADTAEADLDFGLVEQLLRAAGTAFPVAGPAGGPTVSSFTVGAQLLDVVGGQLTGGLTAIFLDDLQWADRKSVEALTFMLRRLSVDPVLAVVTFRGPRDRLNGAAERMLASMEHRLPVTLAGLGPDEVASLVSALRPESVGDNVAQRLYADTGGHPLYLRTLLSEGSGFDSRSPERLALPRSLAAAVGDQLRGLPPETRTILEMLAVLNLRMPLAQLGQAAQVSSPSATIEPAVAAGLVDWWPEEPVCPVQIRHQLVREAIYARITATQRRLLHTRAAIVVGENASWEHRVAALEEPDEDLAARLERLATEEAAVGRQALAATHLRWASDISPERADRERRLLTAALHLSLAEESPAGALRAAVEATAPSPLRGCVLGTMAYSAGQLAEAERWLTEAFAQARDDPGHQALFALITNRLAGTYSMLGDGPRVAAYGRQALDSGLLDPAVASQTRMLIAMGTSQVSDARGGLSELTYLPDGPGQVRPIDVDSLSYRGLLRLLVGEVPQALDDLKGSLALARQGATLTLGLRAYFWLALAQYLAGAWDDTLLTVEQGFSAAAIHTRRFELPLLHLAAASVPAARGATKEAERHAMLAAQAAASMDYGHERLYAAMAHALVSQAAGDYLGMADALGPWQDDSALEGRSRTFAIWWRPLLAEGLIGSGQLERADAVLSQLRAGSTQINYLTPLLAWLDGWLAEQRGQPERALQLYEGGEDSGGFRSPVHDARLLLAHGQLLRRTGHRRQAVDRLRRASEAYQLLRAAPFLTRAEEELAACRLPGGAPPGGLAKKRSALSLTSRETEVAHLVGKGLSNPEIAAELFISRKAVEYHLSNVYAKCGLHGRQQLRRFVEQWRQAAPA